LFEGDGCDRIRSRFGINTFESSYKTTSIKLANELSYILKTRFDVFSSIHHGISKERFIEGRKLLDSDYYNVEVYGKNNLDKLFDNYNKSAAYANCLTGKYSGNKGENFIEVKSIIDAGKQDVYDITLDDKSNHIFTLQYGIKTHNCGGGEATEHPQFVDILKYCRSRDIVPNFTTKSTKWLQDDAKANAIMGLCGSFAYSISTAQEAIDFTDLFSAKYEASNWKYNAEYSFNYALGTADREELKKIFAHCLTHHITINVLGYKSSGRANSFIPYDNSKWLDDVVKVYKQLYTKARGEKYIKLGVDTMAAKQYEAKLKAKKISDIFYDTEEGKFSMYIDAVAGLVGKSSYGNLELFVRNYNNKLCDYFKKY
jgi:hypothetical protein